MSAKKSILSGSTIELSTEVMCNISKQQSGIKLATSPKNCNGSVTTFAPIFPIDEPGKITQEILNKSKKLILTVHI